MDVARIEKVVNEKLEGTDMFLVEVRLSPSNEIDVVVDSDTAVGLDACVELNRAVNAAFDREEEDFSLTVASAGIGQPLKLTRQYRKLIGREVEIVLKDGTKLSGRLTGVSDEAVEVEYSEKVAVEGKKRRQTVAVTRTVAFAEMKSACEHLSFK